MNEEGTKMRVLSVYRVFHDEYFQQSDNILTVQSPIPGAVHCVVTTRDC